MYAWTGKCSQNITVATITYYDFEDAFLPTNVKVWSINSTLVRKRNAVRSLAKIFFSHWLTIVRCSHFLT